MTGLVQAMLATYETDRETRRLRHLTELATLTTTINAMVEAAGPVGGEDESADWEIIFHAVFGGRLATEQQRLFGELQLAMPEYYDPDCSCGTDAMAWIEAYRSVAQPLLEAILSWGTADPCLSAIAGEMEGMQERARSCQNGELAALHIGRARAALDIMAAAT